MYFTGVVKKGAQRGKELGFPTVNIPLTDASVSGIYAARVKVGEETYEAAAYADKKGKVLEAHILDFDDDLYGWKITIELLKKIREDKKFPDESSLKEVIAADIARIRSFFRK